MSNFIPSKNELFYVQFKPVQLDGYKTHHDTSYSGYVFECSGRDDYSVVGTVKHGSRLFDKPLTFVQSRCIFAPVGPEVAAALGINQEQS